MRNWPYVYALLSNPQEWRTVSPGPGRGFVPSCSAEH
jgi:hypothetical protein